LCAQEKEEAEKVNNRLREQLANYKVPDVMDYVQEKSLVQEIRKKVNSMERKLQVTEVSIRDGS